MNLYKADIRSWASFSYLSFLWVRKQVSYISTLYIILPLPQPFNFSHYCETSLWMSLRLLTYFQSLNRKRNPNQKWFFVINAALAISLTFYHDWYLELRASYALLNGNPASNSRSEFFNQRRGLIPHARKMIPITLQRNKHSTIVSNVSHKRRHSRDGNWWIGMRIVVNQRLKISIENFGAKS